jgi:hypothetical protein
MNVCPKILRLLLTQFQKVTIYCQEVFNAHIYTNAQYIPLLFLDTDTLVQLWTVVFF